MTKRQTAGRHPHSLGMPELPCAAVQQREQCRLLTQGCPRQALTLQYQRVSLRTTVGGLPAHLQHFLNSTEQARDCSELRSLWDPAQVLRRKQVSQLRRGSELR